MKHKLLPLALLFIVLLSSCGIQKRLYRPGFYIPDRSFSRNNAEKEEPQPPVDTAAAVVVLKEAKNAESSSVVPGSSADSVKEEEPSFVEELIPAKKQAEERISRGIVHTKQVFRKAKSTAMSDEDQLLLIGLGVLVVGGLIFWLGYSLKVVNPVLANTIMVIGAVIIVIGIIIMGIGYPEIFGSIIDGMLM
jgi:hypothetical protein